MHLAGGTWEGEELRESFRIMEGEGRLKNFCLNFQPRSTNGPFALTESCNKIRIKNATVYFISALLRVFHAICCSSFRKVMVLQPGVALKNTIFQTRMGCLEVARD